MVVITGKNCLTASEIYAPLKRSYTDKFWIYMPQAWIMIHIVKLPLSSLKSFRINYIAAHGHTAAEVIYGRADAAKPFMGLTSFSGELPALKDIGIAKNYLSESELKVLNNLVSGYFDLAEINAIEHKPMYM